MTLAARRHREVVADEELAPLVRHYAIWHDMPAKYAEAMHELKQLEEQLDQPPLLWTDLGAWARALLRAELVDQAFADGTYHVPGDYRDVPVEKLRAAISIAAARGRGAPAKSARKMAAIMLRDLFEQRASRGGGIPFSATADPDFGDSEAVRSLCRVAILAGDATLTSGAARKLIEWAQKQGNGQLRG